jgi:autotransporter-associated beta strand protein
LVASGSGFIGTPVVTISPAGSDTTGHGATANAIIDAGGNLTGLVITNPGTDYTATPTFTILGGGVSNTGSITGTASLVPNTSGGLTKLGTGTLTLGGVSTYAGPTTVSKGTLVVVSGAINNTSKLIMNGGTLDTQGGSLALTSTTLLATASSAINMHNSGLLELANSSGETWAASGAGGLLRIVNWTSGSSQLILDGATPLTPTQVSDTHFATYLGTGALANNVSFPTSKELVPSQTAVRTWRGDLDGSGKSSTTAVVPTGADLTKLEAALANESGYMNNTISGGNGYGTTLNFGDFLDIADVNNDGTVDNGDLQAEINAVINGVAPSPLPSGAVPEPSGVILLGVGGVLYLLMRNRK